MFDSCRRRHIFYENTRILRPVNLINTVEYYLHKLQLLARFREILGIWDRLGFQIFERQPPFLSVYTPIVFFPYLYDNTASFKIIASPQQEKTAFLS